MYGETCDTHGVSKQSDISLYVGLQGGIHDVDIPFIRLFYAAQETNYIASPAFVILEKLLSRGMNNGGTVWFHLVRRNVVFSDERHYVELGCRRWLLHL